MHIRFSRLGRLGFIFILGLVSCSNHVAAATIEDEIVNAESGHEPVSLPTRTIQMAEIPVLVSTISSPKQPDELFPANSPTPSAEIFQPSQSAYNSQIHIETPLPEFQICSPIANVELNYLIKIISDPYRPPPPGSDDRHEGVDFSYYNLAGKKTFIAGVGIQSVLPGIVAAAITNSFPYGNFVIVETPRDWLPAVLRHRLDIPEGSSLYLLYAHMHTTPRVTLGAELRSCELIGEVGNTGNSAVAHLHLEARRGPAGAVFEMMAAFQPTISPEERANYKLWRTSGQFIHFDPMHILNFR